MSAGHPTRIGVALLILAAVAVPFAARLGVDNRIELWVDPHGPTAADYARFRHAFGSDELAIAAYEGREIFDVEALRAQLAALENVEAVPHVTRVLGVPALWRERFEPEPAALRDVSSYESAPTLVDLLIEGIDAIFIP